MNECVSEWKGLSVCVWGGLLSTKAFEDGAGEQHQSVKNNKCTNKRENSVAHINTCGSAVVSHLVRRLALEAADIQRSDEGHILKAVLHAHRFGPFVLKITPQFHHISPTLYIPLFP